MVYLKEISDSRTIYLDNASSTPVLKEVIDEMIPYLGIKFGNPSSVHQYGRESKLAMHRARKRVAQLINAEPNEIFFTSGGTESDNIAISGVAKYSRIRNKCKNHIVTSSIEHDAIIETCKDLMTEDFKITFLPVDKYGAINPKDLKNAITENTILVSIMYANNEVGTIQPIKELLKLTKEINKEIIFHSDAVQAVGRLPLDMKDINIDMMSLSSHKIYGPKGVGAIFIRKGIKTKSIIHGGGQERTLRSGTENVHGIIGFGKACEIAKNALNKNIQQYEMLRDRLIKGVIKIPNSRLNGSKENRLSNNAHFTFFKINGEDLVTKLDENRVYTSTGSACSVNKQKPSHVLKAMGFNHEEITGSLRISIGIQNSVKDIDNTIKILRDNINELRKITPFKS
ncbi:MAG: cysteine desulfurase family protein [Nitrososphaeraceae archaeon]